MDVIITGLIAAIVPTVTTIGSSIIINRNTDKFKKKLGEQSALFQSEISKQEEIFKSELNKQIKISSIYYEQRAKILQQLYLLLVTRNNKIVQRMKFLNDTADGGQYVNPKPFYKLFDEFEKDESDLDTVLLQSSLFLSPEDYSVIKSFHTLWSKPISVIVDLYELYKKVPNKENEEFTKSENFAEFSKEVIKKELYTMEENYRKLSGGFGNVRDIIKKTIESKDMQ
ncbi:hypothetical protein [Lactococcus petauri]|uniref:hypothetical protein n=1 Tax=Lactococcus petauri TaxID=1940789 RepID=UPI00129EDB58|nr:hypothetical protein [Lactococcus petauri]